MIWDVCDLVCVHIRSAFCFVWWLFTSCEILSNINQQFQTVGNVQHSTAHQIKPRKKCARDYQSEKQEKGGIDFNWKNNFFSCHFFRAFKSFVSLTRKEEKWMKNCSTNSSHFSGSTLDQCDAATRTNYARRKLFLWKNFAGSTPRVLLLKNMKNCWWNWKSW